ncbi:Endonuclease/exonuclease/phosphatase [Clohesyomyces aquaticus]|uniref:Endonuclease/exonuclease/phosphatase n=1 Tax=Clohesyomyces aquaticus TaxID=1231657 RepID=A0A1Y2A5F6_9PLEO|nr:Endonuclease/exonuclease/phosphatase [Clohesyomyces aquaticus]
MGEKLCFDGPPSRRSDTRPHCSPTNTFLFRTKPYDVSPLSAHAGLLEIFDGFSSVYLARPLFCPLNARVPSFPTTPSPRNSTSKHAVESLAALVRHSSALQQIEGFIDDASVAAVFAKTPPVPRTETLYRRAAKMLDLYVVTFNCGRNQVDHKALGRCLFDGTPRGVTVPDILALCLQEIAPIFNAFTRASLQPYFSKIEDTVHYAVHRRSNGQEFLEHVTTRHEGMTAIMIFSKSEYLEKIKWTQSAGVGTGFLNMGNKGAVAVRLGLPTRRFQEIYGLTIVAAHLAPGEGNCKRRNEDWEAIVRNLVFTKDGRPLLKPDEETPLLADLSDKADDFTGLYHRGTHLVVAGDLNYRSSDTKPPRNAYKSWPPVSARDCSAQAESTFGESFPLDQLAREMSAGRTLHGLAERAVRFSPTYKYKLVGEENWAWARHRFPSWCDRILYQRSAPSGPQLQGQLYLALDCQPTSDHRPVAMSFRVDETPFGRSAADVPSPFPLNPRWEQRRALARQLEFWVGLGSLAVTTWLGLAICVFSLVVAGSLMVLVFGIACWTEHC